MISALQVFRKGGVSIGSGIAVRNLLVSGPWAPRSHIRLSWQQRSEWETGTESGAAAEQALKREPDREVRVWLFCEVLTYFQQGPAGQSSKWLLRAGWEVEDFSLTSAFPSQDVLWQILNCRCLTEKKKILTDLIWGFFYPQSRKLVH